MSQGVKVGKGLPGRLSKGAGTHLASWLQESNAIAPEEAQLLLDSGDTRAKTTDKGSRALTSLRGKHGKRLGHSNPVTDVAFSGELLASKDVGSLRLWRAHGDHALLRVVSCRGKHVAFHHSGQFIVTGQRNKRGEGGEEEEDKEELAISKTLKIWGPAGGSAVGVGNKKITTGVAEYMQLECAYDAVRIAARATVLLGGGDTAAKGIGPVVSAVASTAQETWGSSGQMALDEINDLYRALYDVYAVQCEGAACSWGVVGGPIDGRNLTTAF